MEVSDFIIIVPVIIEKEFNSYSETFWLTTFSICHITNMQPKIPVLPEWTGNTIHQETRFQHPDCYDVVQHSSYTGGCQGLKRKCNDTSLLNSLNVGWIPPSSVFTFHS